MLFLVSSGLSRLAGLSTPESNRTRTETCFAMLKRRLIPKLQMKTLRGRPVLVTTVRFGDAAPVGDAAAQARVYQAQMVDELVFLDLEATPESRLAPVDVIRRAAEEI